MDAGASGPADRLVVDEAEAVAGLVAADANDDRAVTADAGRRAVDHAYVRQKAQADHTGVSRPAKGLPDEAETACADDDGAVGADAGCETGAVARQETQSDHAGTSGPAEGLAAGGGVAQDD